MATRRSQQLMRRELGPQQAGPAFDTGSPVADAGILALLPLDKELWRSLRVAVFSAQKFLKVLLDSRACARNDAFVRSAGRAPAQGVLSHDARLFPCGPSPSPSLLLPIWDVLPPLVPEARRFGALSGPQGM